MNIKGVNDLSDVLDTLLWFMDDDEKVSFISSTRGISFDEIVDKACELEDRAVCQAEYQAGMC